MADGTAEPFHAADDLAAMRASRARLLDKPCPPWRHALFAGAMSAAVATQALPPPWNLGAVAVLVAAVIALAVWMRARRGVFINGLRAGATRPWAAAALGVYMADYTACLWLRDVDGQWAAPLFGAAVLFPVAWWFSRRINAAYRAEMRA